ncbi:MAG: transcriptional regulator [Candidatus Woesebacteria bacterium GW2011_GWB1_44_11]|uniref:Transcriptional regulator n=4 Tax=Candidatus Woeseibacteriota TaxID=1752722 RepID=A0A837I941_9BACT|nr:MAG: transcriptional regulator [Candidatus Woesebacteria bacterium GW2011_GWB1_44_11]KKT53983.1 MAG: transcriptional regulator [Candidatus Woesebacteria bacterium GW2011_GWA1_44_23]
MRLYFGTYMEEGQNQETQTQAVTQETSTRPSSGVSFPTVGEPKKSGGAKTLLIIGVLILIGILGFVIYKNASDNNEEGLGEPTPFENLNAPSQNETVSSPTPTAAPSTVDKTKVKIQIQNGTGITGEAAYLQTQLKDLGYTNIVLGNSTQQDLTATQVGFAGSLSSEVVREITAELNTIYQSVTTITPTSTTYDVVIITGLRKGATPKPSTSPRPSATPTPTPTATP